MEFFLMMVALAMAMSWDKLMINNNLFDMKKWLISKD